MDIRQQVLDKLSYGLYIVTSHDGNGRLNGQVSDALMQVAAVPPRFAVSINKSELTHDFIRASGRIGVTVLAREAPQAFIGLFGFQSGRDIDKLAQAGHRIGRTGAPLVTDHAVAVYEGAVFQAVDAGTHTVFFADVEAAEMVSDTLPMTYAYYTEFLKGRIPENAPTYHGPEAQPRPGDTAGGAGRYVCDICGYVYDPDKGDPDQGIQPGTPFEELPDEWICPICGVGTDRFTAETPPPAKQEGRYVCDVCGYIYDPEQGDPDQGVAPGTPFDDLPGDWVCPVCGVGREEFSPADG